MESMIQRGRIDRDAAERVINGNVFVRVRIYGNGARGDSVSVTVE